MDTEVFRTFLEVNRTRHFARAAENLFVTQAAVSARIRQLEGALGTPLFTRSRNNIQLTLAGHKLIPYAEAVLNAWNRALVETGSKVDSRTLVVLGCLPSLWEIFFSHWLADFYATQTELILQIELLDTAAMVPRVREQSVSLGLLYEPPQTPDLAVEQIAGVELVMVSTSPGLSISDSIPNYVYVDWGTSFALSHSTHLLKLPSPILSVDTPGTAYDFLLQRGGTAYLARQMIQSERGAGRLHLVSGAPVLDRAVYLIRPAQTPPNHSLDLVMENLRGIDYA